MPRARKRLSSSTGKLTGRARRTRLGRLKEGEVSLFSTNERLKKGQATGLIQAEFGVKQYATVLVDARRMIRIVQKRLAEQFSEDLDKQRRPDTGTVYYKWDGKMRTTKKGVSVKGETEADREYFRKTGGRIDPRYLIQSGKLQRTWWISKVTGSIYRGRATLRPTKDGYKLQRVNELKKRGMVFQSVRGRAQKTIEAAVREYQGIMVNPPRDVPARPDLTETDLVRLGRI